MLSSSGRTSCHLYASSSITVRYFHSGWLSLVWCHIQCHPSVSDHERRVLLFCCSCCLFQSFPLQYFFHVVRVCACVVCGCMRMSASNVMYIGQWNPCRNTRPCSTLVNPWGTNKHSCYASMLVRWRLFTEPTLTCMCLLGSSYGSGRYVSFPNLILYYFCH